MLLKESPQYHYRRESVDAPLVGSYFLAVSVYYLRRFGGRIELVDAMNGAFVRMGKLLNELVDFHTFVALVTRFMKGVADNNSIRLIFGDDPADFVDGVAHRSYRQRLKNRGDYPHGVAFGQTDAATAIVDGEECADIVVSHGEKLSDEWARVKLEREGNDGGFL